MRAFTIWRAEDHIASPSLYAEGIEWSDNWVTARWWDGHRNQEFSSVRELLAWLPYGGNGYTWRWVTSHNDD